MCAYTILLFTTADSSSGCINSMSYLLKPASSNMLKTGSLAVSVVGEGESVRGEGGWEVVQTLD